MRETLSYDDVLLVPQYSEIPSRSEEYIDVSVKLGPYKYNHPIIPANMPTVISDKMARSVVESGGLALLHRVATWQKQELMYVNASPYGTKAPLNVGLSIGVNYESTSDFWALFKLTSCNIWCVDVAHGDHKLAIEMVKFLKSHKRIIGYDPLVIAGNVVTGEGAKRLWEAGADVVKVGVGPGSICTTRIKTGHGLPQLTALMDVHTARETHYPDRQIIADGGIKDSGDIVKALCFSDAVMIGNLFAGCNEAPGNIVFDKYGVKYKEYDGASTYKNKNVEGVKGLVLATDKSFTETLNTLLEGVRSGCSYAGVNNIHDLQDNPQMVRITNNGLTESRPHGIKVNLNGDT